MAKRKLGRGLGALLGRGAAEARPTEEVRRVATAEIEPNPWQPRAQAGAEGLKGLVDSIRAHGVLQPVVLRRQAEGSYELVVGERRWRAALEAGLAEIPAVIRDVPDTQMLLLAVLENIQREDLNAIERAGGYAALMKNLGWTQERLAEHLGEARTTVSNTVRLLELPEEIQDLVSRGTLSAGHGRALLSLRDAKAQAALCRRILKENLSVRQAEAVAAGASAGGRATRQAKPTPPHIREIQQQLAEALGAKVTVKERKKGGRITIDFADHDDFDRIMAIIERGRAREEGTASFHV